MKEVKNSKIGRPKNSKNKNTEVVRSSFQLLIQNNLEQLQSDLDEMTPKERFSSIVSLASFVVPKLNSIDFTTETRNMFKPIQLNFDSNETD